MRCKALVLRLAACCCLLLLPGAVACWAQSTYGIILGVVTDSSSAIVSGANVTATNVATNFSRTVATGLQGDYRIPNLLPGRYEVAVEMAGFKKAINSDIVVRVNETVRVDFGMEVGNVVESISVTSAAPLLETASATVGRVVTNEKIVELPLNGRDFTRLTLLLPGASPGASSGGGFLIGAQRWPLPETAAIRTITRWMV